MHLSNIQFRHVFLDEKDKEIYENKVANITGDKLKEWMEVGEIYGVHFKKFRSLRISSRDIFRIVNDGEADFQHFLNRRFRPIKSYNFKPLRDGEKLEKPAINLYEALTMLKTVKIKHLVNPNFPWIIAAPDTMVTCGDIIYKGVEIKSTYQPSTTDHKYLCSSAVYKKNGEYVINTKSETYCQIQMCMAVSNLRKWDLVIYFSDKKIQVIPVTYDEKHIRFYIALACEKYFTRYLPRLRQVLQSNT